MQFVREDRGPVLSGLIALVWSLYKPHKTPYTERSDQFVEFISLHSVCACVCVGVGVGRWCTCACGFARVCLFVPHTNGFDPS